MTNNPLSKRAEQALSILENGGQFVTRLERNSYTGREQFQTRLLSKTGDVVKGFGLKTFGELKTMLRISSTTTVSTRYSLPSVREPEAINWNAL